MAEAFVTWQDIHAEVLRRIRSREWPPGAQIPSDADLAEGFGCARATVSRALRELAEAGLLTRRRKAGTRVALDPVRKATLQIPVIHDEVEARGGRYGYALIARATAAPPPAVRSRMGLSADAQLLHLKALHLSDGAPYAFEDRWVNLNAVPALAEVDLERISANAWLVRNVPYSRGELTLSSQVAEAETASALQCPSGAALFLVERTTWMADQPITWVRQCYPPGYRLSTAI